MAGCPCDLPLPVRAQDEQAQLASELKDSSWKSVGKATEMAGRPSAAELQQQKVAAGSGAAERFDALYEVGAVLGKGTYGSVRMAKHRKTKQVRRGAV